MLRLTNQQQRFVEAFFELREATAAARAAGYSDKSDGCQVTGHRLVHSANVIAAIQEEARHRYVGLLPKALRAQEEIVDDPGHRDRLKAAVHISAAAGIAAVVEHKVEHVLTVSEQFAELIRLGKKPEEVLMNLPPEEKKKVIELVKGEGYEVDG